MIKRLWLLLCVLWTFWMLSLAWIGYGQMAELPEYADALRNRIKLDLWLASLPWLAGYLLPFLMRWLVRGNPRKRVFQPRPY